MLVVGHSESITIVVIDPVNMMSLKGAKSLFTRPCQHDVGQFLLDAKRCVDASLSIDLELNRSTVQLVNIEEETCMERVNRAGSLGS